MGRSIINDVQVGLDTKISLVSQTHGRIRVPLAQTLAFTPKKTVGLVQEFDNRNPVLAYETFEGCQASFETMLSDGPLVTSAVMDLDSNQAIMSNDPANHQQLRAVYCNYTGRNSGYQYGFEYLENARLSANASSHALKTETKITHTMEGTRYYRFVGKTGQKCALQYVRFYYLTRTFVTADDVAMGSASTGTFPNTPVAFPLPPEENRGTTQNYVSAFWTKSGANTATPLNGNSNDGAVDFIITNAIFTLQASGLANIPSGAVSSGDIVEFFVVVQPASPIS